MLSQEKVYARLRDGFVGVRLDWEQGNHYREKFGFVLGTGDQMLLTPAGEPISHDGATKDGRHGIVYGRHGRDTTPDVLDAVLRAHPPRPGPPALELEWFLWPRMESAARAGGFYPPPADAAAGYARLPLALVEGPIPGALRNPAFLRWHVRQFIWARGRTEGGSRVVLRRVKDGLKPGLSQELGALDPEAMSAGEFGAALDRAWLAYMRDRPAVAQGYLDNPHGKWMRAAGPQMLEEERAIRAGAAAGTLAPPGRAAGEAKPY